MPCLFTPPFASVLQDLLSGQFNVTLGEKLTEHLQKWMDVEKFIFPPPPQPVAWEAGTEWEVAARMLDIFHKLPPAAKDFLETRAAKPAEGDKPAQESRPGIVVLTIGLEENLHRLPGAVVSSKMWSPYRAPLTRFLNRYPQESVAYFLGSSQHLANPQYFTRLLDIIRNPLGRPLLDALAGSTAEMVAVLSSIAEDDETRGAHCVRLFSTCWRRPLYC